MKSTDSALVAPSNCNAAVLAAGATDAPARQSLVGYRVVLCTDEDGFYVLEAEWNQLLGRAHSKSVFLRHEWMSTWWRLIGSVTARCDLFVLSARDASGELAGVLPLYRESRGAWPFEYRVLRILGTTHEGPEHLDAIVGETDHLAVLELLLEALESYRGEYEALELTDLAEDAVLASAVRGWSDTRGWLYRTRTSQECPYIATTGKFADYLTALSSKHRYKVRHFGRQLAEKYDVNLVIARTPADVKVAIEEHFVLHAKRWTLKEYEVSGFDNDLAHTFHRTFALHLAEADAIRLFLLRCDGRAVAACYCLCYDNRMFFYQPGFDPDFRQFHVGKVLLGNVLEYCFENGIREFDFLRGLEEYKFDWTKQKRRTVTCFVGLSLLAKTVCLTGEVISAIKEEGLRYRKQLVLFLKTFALGRRVVAALKPLIFRQKKTPAAHS